MTGAAESPATLPVSVVIPAFNREDLLAGAIRSAQAQVPAPPAEIVVVDDASTDATAAVAEALGVRVIRHPENRGEGGARNTALDTASHDWVALLDSDDEWLPGHLAQLWVRRAGHLLVSSSAVTFGDAPTTLLGPSRPRPTVVARPDELLFPENPITASGVLARRDALLAAGGFGRAKVGADLDMWIRLAERGTLLACPEVGYRYRVHASQVTRDPALIRDELAALLAAYAERPWWTPQVARRVEHRAAWERVTAAARARDAAEVAAAAAALVRAGGAPDAARLLRSRLRRRLRSRSALAGV